MSGIDHIAARTWHGRRGAVRNAFQYGVDYVMLDAEADLPGPGLFGRNARGLTALHDSDHGGPPGAGRGAAWVRQVLAAHGIALTGRIDLLAQPRVLGHVFNPVSFWLIHDAGGALACVIPEVTNTFGDRHSYICAHPDLRPITGTDVLSAQKNLHVSPFQPVEGGYQFSFDITAQAINIRIDYARGDGGLVATLAGRRRPLTNGSILRAVLRRPFGSRRVLALIHWQALKLWWKGAGFRPRPTPPPTEVSR